MSQHEQPSRALPSRRDFIRRSSAAVAAGSLAGTLAVPRSVFAGADDTIRIGLIGCGGRGRGAAAQALQTGGKVKLVAMADAFEDQIAAGMKNLQAVKEIEGLIDVPKERQFAGFDGYQKVLDSGVDLVILATPPGFRPLHFAEAVKRDKHVFMEKPVAVDAPGVRKVLAAVEESKRKKLAVGVGLQRHHQRSYQETVQRLQDGAIGDIVSARAYWNSYGVWDPRKTREECATEMEYQMRNWYYYNWLCGDHIVEQHIHNLDVINWIKNAYPVSAQGMGGREVRNDPKYGEIYDHHAVEFAYADGSRMFSFCRHIPNTWRAVEEYVQGTKGSADVSKGVIEPTEGSPFRFRGESPNPYQVEHNVLQESIRSGNPINEGENGALSTMTAIFGRMATYSGQMLTWEQALNSDVTYGPEEVLAANSSVPAANLWQVTPPVPSIAVPGQTKVV